MKTELFLDRKIYPRGILENPLDKYPENPAVLVKMQNTREFSKIVENNQQKLDFANNIWKMMIGY